MLNPDQRRTTSTRPDANGAGRVIVGVSGSLANLSALHVAVAEARATGLALLAVTAWLPPDGNLPRWGREPIERSLQELSARQLADAFTDAFGAVPTDICVEARVACGDPAQVLVATSTHPRDVLVVGASRPRVTRTWGGSVSGYCARNARCPVMTVPRPLLLKELRGRIRTADLRA
jgi:nucleotide-binding universal stress UspA family protein